MISAFVNGCLSLKRFFVEEKTRWASGSLSEAKLFAYANRQTYQHWSARRKMVFTNRRQTFWQCYEGSLNSFRSWAFLYWQKIKLTSYLVCIQKQRSLINHHATRDKMTKRLPHSAGIYLYSVVAYVYYLYSLVCSQRLFVYHFYSVVYYVHYLNLVCYLAVVGTRCFNCITLLHYCTGTRHCIMCVICHLYFVHQILCW